MNLRRQLLLVSLLTLVLPWAGCQFVRETESALRAQQQDMLDNTAQAIADSLSQFPDEFLASQESGAVGGEQLFAHPLAGEPLLDGYYDDWSIGRDALREMRGIDGPIRFALGVYGQQLWCYIEVPDDTVIYRGGGPGVAAAADRVEFVSAAADGGETRFVLAAEAPGSIVAQRFTAGAAGDEQRLAAYWQDTPRGYQLEARIPRQLLAAALGIVVTNTDDRLRTGTRSSSYGGTRPGRLVTPSPLLASVLSGYAQRGLRLMVTDTRGWRLADAGSLHGGDAGSAAPNGWLRLAYGALLGPDEGAKLAAPDPSGLERQPYIVSALGGTAASGWFRSAQTGRAVAAVARPVWSGNVQTGVLVLQQGTDAILSLTNEALARLMSFTLIATLLVAGVLLGYASWMSHRIRRLSNAARHAVDSERVSTALPSGGAGDEVGDLSRSFSSVLKQLGDYNDYLKSLASKLSHELRTPLTIVRSSLENLDHEPLSGDAVTYTSRARDGVDRLQKILNAMSEASRVEEMIGHADSERFDLRRVLDSTIAAYADAWPARRFVFDCALDAAFMRGAPELVIQMLDKLIDNAIEFSTHGDELRITLARGDGVFELTVDNPGPPLPAKMRSQLFDSMISVRSGGGREHLGLGLFIARLIAEGHRGSIQAENTDGGVRLIARLAVH
ncbi:MAG TPA: ATP-binding protein [Woeseiaceae bacterium]|nr:ATP-binding protein [Woeseiaceae bacterium]